MKSLVYVAPETVEVRENPVPEPKEGQVRIKVKYCGVCGSDIHIYKGTHPRAKAPLIMGHEFIGTIESIPGTDGGAASPSLWASPFLLITPAGTFHHVFW